MPDLMSLLNDLHPAVQILSALGALGVAWRLVRTVLRWRPPLKDGESPDSLKRKERDSADQWGKFPGVPSIQTKQSAKHWLMEGQFSGDEIKLSKKQLREMEKSVSDNWERYTKRLLPSMGLTDAQRGNIIGVAKHGALKGELVTVQMSGVVDVPLAERQKVVLERHRQDSFGYSSARCCLDCTEIVPGSMARCRACHEKWAPEEEDKAARRAADRAVYDAVVKRYKR